jgi:hypothetical protein
MGVIKHDYAVPLLVVMPLQICNETQCMDALRCDGLRRKLSLNNFSQVQKSF